MTDQEIRAKALEITVQMLALVQPEIRSQVLNSKGKDIQQNVIATSLVFEKHIKGN